MLAPIHRRSCVLFILGLVSFALAQSSTTLNPPSIPIVLRSPYFNAWISTLPNTSVHNPPDLGAVRLWNAQTVGWSGFVRVDGQLYGWLGVGGDNKTTTLASYVTPTQTIFTLRTGPVDLNVTFLSPVEPDNWARQSFPFSYLAIDVLSRDGSEHSVQVYADLTGEWISDNLNTSTRPSTTRGNAVVYHSTVRTIPSLWVEENEVAQDETLIFASANSNTLSTQAGSSAAIRASLTQRGRLSNSADGADTPISPAYPAVALAIDLGSITQTPSPSPALFALGIIRDPLIRYGRGSVVEFRRPYWTAKWSNISDALGQFIADYPAALTRAQTFDAKVMSDARAAGSSQYADLVALSVRQLFASVDLTTGQSNGSLEDVKAFMKDVGIGRRVNPVDTLYAAFPGFLYFNASMGGLLLEPLLQSQSSLDYQHTFAGPDLGSNYPTTALNNSDTQTLAVDSCASMLIMSWLYTQKSGNGVLIDEYYALLKKWADYLVDNALRPTGFYTSDGLTNPNNSNLALKGILGIYAMSQINKALENRGVKSSVTEHYASVARSQYSEWEGLAFASGRIISSYNQPSSWTLAYNLYSAMLMGVDFIGKNVYDGQTSFYSSQLATSGSRLGLGYDSNAESIVKSQWMLFTAATATSTSVRDAFISNVYNRTFTERGVIPFSTTWDLRSGGSPPAPAPDGRSSPAQGAMLSLLALKLPNVAITFDSNGVGGGGSGGSPKKPNIGAIIGGVLGGLAAALALGLILFFFVIRKRKQQQREPKPFDASNTNLGVPPAMIQPPPPSPSVAAGPTTGQSDDTSPTSSFFTRFLHRRTHTPESLPTPFIATSPTSPSTNATRSVISEKRAIQSHLAATDASSSSSTSLPLSSPSSGLSYVSPISPRSGSDMEQVNIRGPYRPVVKQRIIHGSNSSVTQGYNPPSVMSSAVSTAPSSTLLGGATDDLRAEVVELRRQMAVIQARTMSATSVPHVDSEPPPSYFER